MKREDKDTESSRTKIDETLTADILTVALGKTEFDYQEELYQYSVFDSFDESGFRFKQPNALFSDHGIFYE